MTASQLSKMGSKLGLNDMINYIKTKGGKEFVEQFNSIKNKTKAEKKGYSEAVQKVYENAKSHNLGIKRNTYNARKAEISQIRGYRNVSELTPSDLTINEENVKRIQKNARNNHTKETEQYRHRGIPEPEQYSDMEPDGQMTLGSLIGNNRAETRESYTAKRREERINGRSKPVPSASEKESSPFLTDEDGQLSFDLGKDNPFTINDTPKEITTKNSQTGQLETRKTTAKERQEMLKQHFLNKESPAKKEIYYQVSEIDKKGNPTGKTKVVTENELNENAPFKKYSARKMDEAPTQQIEGQDELVINSVTGNTTTKNERLERQQQARNEQVQKDSRNFGQRVLDGAKDGASAAIEMITGEGDDASKFLRGRKKRRTNYEAAQEHFRITGEGNSQTPSQYYHNLKKTKTPKDIGDYSSLADWNSKKGPLDGSGISEWAKEHQLLVAGGIAAAGIGVGSLLSDSSNDRGY